MKNKKGFTLIELIAVIVILGVLMLIAIPAVSRYINESKKKAYIATVKSIVDTVRYGVTSGDSNYSMDGVEEKTFNFADIETEKGKISNIEGYVKVVKNTDGGGYSYKVSTEGSNEESKNYCIDEIDINNLTNDSLVKCNGIQYRAYSIGDTIRYKESNWRVIKNSTTSEDYVTLLKETILTGTEIGANYVWSGNTSNSFMAYYWSSTCHINATYEAYTYDSYDDLGCSGHSNYAGSKLKEVVDNYMTTNNMTNDLKEVANYKIRLIMYDEIISNLGYEYQESSPSGWHITENTPTWVYGSSYWSMTPDANNPLNVRYVNTDGDLYSLDVRYGSSNGVRPVINLLKSAIQQ